MRFFLEDSVEVSRPFEAVREHFVSDGTWFVPLASAAEEDGEALYLRIGPSWASGRVARKVRVTLGPPRDRGVTVVVPVSWQSSGLPALFPVLDGDVELLPLNPDHCLSPSLLPTYHRSDSSEVSSTALCCNASPSRPYVPSSPGWPRALRMRTSVDGLRCRASREIEPQPHISHEGLARSSASTCGTEGVTAFAPRPRVRVGETDKVDEHESGQPGETGEDVRHRTLIRHQKQLPEHCEQNDVGHKDHPEPEQGADRAVPHSLSMDD